MPYLAKNVNDLAYRAWLLTHASKYHKIAITCLRADFSLKRRLQETALFPGSAPPAGGGSAALKNMYFVYAIYNSKNNKIYIGQTDNFVVRLDLHDKKEFKNSYTSRFDGEWKCIYKEEAKTRIEALKREKQLKSFRGREFIWSLVKNNIPG